MQIYWLVVVGAISGAGAGLLAGLIGIGGGIVVVPVVYYGLIASGASADQAAHVAVGTSLAAILPTAVVSSLTHWRAGNMDVVFSASMGARDRTRRRCRQTRRPASARQRNDRDFQPVVPGLCGPFCISRPLSPDHRQPPAGGIRNIAATGYRFVFGLWQGSAAGFLRNIVMSLSGMSIHKRHRKGRSRRRSGRPAGDDCCRAGIGIYHSNPSRLHRCCRLGIDRANASRGCLDCVLGSHNASPQRISAA